MMSAVTLTVEADDVPMLARAFVAAYANSSSVRPALVRIVLANPQLGMLVDDEEPAADEDPDPDPEAGNG